MKQIRNFSIISHIDHGKTTLADRFLQKTQTIPQREMREQFLDKMELERERGITIKLQPIRMVYRPKTLNPKFEILNKSEIRNPQNNDLEFSASNLEFANSEYILNLIDTPGHVDFTYEVSRALAACEGAILLVDASKGIQAQTLANLRLAKEHNLKIIAAVNKIDLPNARIKETKLELASLLGIDAGEILSISAKTGEGVDELLEKIATEIPAPAEEYNLQPKALIFDSQFDEYKGIIAYARVVQGELKLTDQLNFYQTSKQFKPIELGYFGKKFEKKDKLIAGEIGYIATGLKNPKDVRIGDTIFDTSAPIDQPLPGYDEPKPKLWASIFCTDSDDFSKLKKAIDELVLNDPSLNFVPDNSSIFGPGFAGGFLGVLHLEITRDRLEREHALDLVISAPSTGYQVKTIGKTFEIKRPSDLPADFIEISEPYVDVEIVSPNNYLGSLIELINGRRGKILDTKYLEMHSIIITAQLPLAEIIFDFYDKLKSLSSGFASMNYKVTGYKKGDLAKLEILIASKPVDAFCRIISKERSYALAKNAIEKLKILIPRQLFEVIIQAKVGGKILASEKIPALRKDVIAKLYGGDRTRKDKLLKKQKAGKKKMKAIGSVEIPKEAFLKYLKI